MSLFSINNCLYFNKQNEILLEITHISTRQIQEEKKIFNIFCNWLKNWKQPQDFLGRIPIKAGVGLNMS